MDELAKLCLRFLGKVYRLKVFPNTLWIEQQPGVVQRAGGSPHVRRR